MSSDKTKRLSAFQSVVQSLRSWRTASVILLSFASGMPLGLVWISIPDWMRNVGVDIRIVGLFTLAQAPWTYKLLWAPLMDRYRVPLLGPRRGWILLTQVVLFLLTLALAGVGNHPDTPWIIAAITFAIAMASASQDIPLDAYAVEILRKEEQGAVVGGRIAVYRAAMYVAGALSITLAGKLSWPLVLVILAAMYIPMMVVTWKAPEPQKDYPKPISLKDAIWNPFIGFLARHRALEILAFVIFYKLADNLAQGLLRPFLVDMHFDDIDRGVALGTIGLAATLCGTFLGGFITTGIGLGHSLWIFGLLQIFSNIGYVLVAHTGSIDSVVDFSDRVIMYGAMGFESFTSGLGTGAFSVLLLRMTQKRFSATQYALFSSLFSLPRLFAGPIAGFTVFAMSGDDPSLLPQAWTTFFWWTIAAGIPGLIFLQRFVPIGTREPEFVVRDMGDQRALSKGAIAIRGLFGSVCGFAFGGACVLFLRILRAARKQSIFDVDVPPILAEIFHPQNMDGWFTIAGIFIFGIVIGLATAAIIVARHGGARALGELDDSEENGAAWT